MVKKLHTKMILSLCAVLTAVAGITVSFGSFALWHEPDCPEELLK